LHEHRSARKRKGVDLFQVHGCERILIDGLLEFLRSHGDQPIAELREVRRDPLVLDDRVLLPHFSSGFEPELHVLLWRVFVLRQLDGGLLRDQGRHRNADRDQKSRCSCRAIDDHGETPRRPLTT
jgi:hypothetical protein